MANKKPLPLEDPPTASSSEDETSEEEEVSSSEEDEPQAPSAAVKVAVPVKPTVDTAEKQEETSEEEEGSSSEEDEDDEPQTAPVKTPPAAVNVAAAEKQEVSESETGSESETDSDSETERPNPPNSAVTVVSPKPKQKEATLALPAVKSGTKRASEGTSRDTKKRGKTVASGDDDKKKSPFARIWSEDDEITVLQGMIDFEADTGKSPYEDTNVYYEFIRKSISFEVSKIQCMDKISRLKNKYMGKNMKAAKSSYTKPHDQKCLTLSKTIWGPEGMALDSVVKSKAVSKKKSTTKKKKLDTVRQELVFNGKNIEEQDKNVVGGGGDLESDWFENSFLLGSISGYGIDENYVKRGWRLVQEETKKKFEDRFNALQAMEIDFVLEKTDLLHEMTSMIAEAFKKSSN